MQAAARALLVAVLATSLAACGGGDSGISIASTPTTPIGGPQQTPGNANEAPSAAADATPRQGSPPLSVAFTATNSGDRDGQIVGFQWDFGDGASARGASATHTYTSIGEFTARLVVTDNDGATGSAAVLISVVGADANLPPAAVFSAEPDGGPAPLAVTFDAGNATDSDGTIARFDWDFGDGGRGDGTVVGHTYSVPGSFTARLTVTDNDGAEASSSLLISVSNAASGGLAGRSVGTAPLAGAVGAGGRQQIMVELRAGQTVGVTVEDHAKTEPLRNDLDAYLFDLADPRRPRYVASSVGTAATESLTAATAGRYALLIESSAGSSGYRVDLDTRAPAPPARLEDEFVAGELIVQLQEGAAVALPIIAGLPGRPLLAGLPAGGVAAGDAFWRQPGAPLQRYATVRAAKRLGHGAGVVSAELNRIRHPEPRASVRGGGAAARALDWPQGLPTPDESGALTSYALIQWLRAVAGLPADATSARADLIELRLPEPSVAELAAIEAATAAGAVVTTRP